MSNLNIKFQVKNKVALFRDNKFVKLFMSQMECAKYYKISEPDLSDFLLKKKDIIFLRKNEYLKIISETQSIKYEIRLFKRHLHYLKKNDFLNFKCNFCLQKGKETLPIKTFQTVGVCESCNRINEVSSGLLNKWLIKRNYTLQISDRSRFLRELMPFELVSTSLPSPVLDNKIVIIEDSLVSNTTKSADVSSNLDTKVDKVNGERLIYAANNEKHRTNIKKDSNFSSTNENYNNWKTDQKKYKKSLNRKLKYNNIKGKFRAFFGYLFLIITSILFCYLIYLTWEEYLEQIKNANKIYTVKAIILEKNIFDNSIIYKNTEGNIFKIPNALNFWDCGEKGDSITVEFKNYKMPTFINVKPILNK